MNDALAELCADVDAVGALQAEGRVARWGWSGGRLAAGNAVPWTTQQYNGLSEALSWQPGDATTVVVAEPGLYEICLGFFTSKRPHVQVLVNGVPALSAFHKGSTVVHEPRVTCLSCVELLQLPHPNSALVVTLSGGGGGGGAGIADVSTTTAATVVATGTARRRATSASGDGGAPTKLPSGRGGGSSRLLLLQGFFSLRKLQP